MKVLMALTECPEQLVPAAMAVMAAMPDRLPMVAMGVTAAIAEEVAMGVMVPMASLGVTGRPEVRVQQAGMPWQSVSVWKIPQCRCLSVVAFTLRQLRVKAVMVAMAARRAPVARVAKPVEAVKVAMPAKRAGEVLPERGHRVVKEVMPVTMATAISRWLTVGMAGIPAMRIKVTMGAMAAEASLAIMA